jgi:hypothetical protein
MFVPNRASDPARKQGDHTTPTVHYTVSYNKPTGELHDGPYGHKVMGTAPDTMYFPDKKSAKTYGNSVADLGFDPYVEKHDKKSQDAGYTQGKPAKLMEAGFQARKFIKGH